MNYANIKRFDIANGPGVRVSLFVSGCTHHCKECFNPETWDFNFGQPYTKEVEDSILKELENPAYSGLTLLGGEPMEPVNQKALVSLVTRFKDKFPEKTLWVYSGYLLDRDILGKMAPKFESTMEILKRVDVLVDGEFMIDLKDITLLFRGSSNQRLINVPETLEKGEIVLWKDASVSMSPNSH